MSLLLRKEAVHAVDSDPSKAVSLSRVWRMMMVVRKGSEMGWFRNM